MLTSTPYTIRNLFDLLSSNINYHLFIPSVVNLLKRLSVKEVSTFDVPLLIFWKKMERKTGIRAIPITDISVKSLNVTPIDFCTFGLLKSALSERRFTPLPLFQKLFKRYGQNTSLKITKGIIVRETTV